MDEANTHPNRKLRDSNEMNLDDDEYRDAVKRWVRREIMEGRMPKIMDLDTPPETVEVDP